MALFTSYAPPGVYTQTIIQTNAAPTNGTQRVPVIIGEGQQFFAVNNVELFRGSSAVQDDEAVNENITPQVTGLTRNFQTTYFPVTDGTGHGTVTNDPSKVQVQAVDSSGNIFPVTVISLNGATGQFSTQQIIPQGTELTIDYFFKRGDTFIGVGGVAPYNVPESLLYQVPVTAALYVNSSGALTQTQSGNILALGLSTPGATGNLVTIQLVDSGTPVSLTLASVAASVGSSAVYTGTITGGAANAFAGYVFTVSGFTNSVNNGTFLCTASSITTLTLANANAVIETHAATAASATGGVVDALAVSGAGSDAVTINIRNANGTLRTVASLITLIAAGIPTLDGGFLTAGTSTAPTQALTAGASVAYSGGSGQNSNTVFKVAHTPVVDGTNGGVVTTDVTKVTVELNGNPVTVASLDGQHGLVTLASPVPPTTAQGGTTSSLTISYYFNTWPNTFDLLPDSNVEAITLVGLGPDRADFIQGTDYVLGKDSAGNGTVQWGSYVTEAIDISAAGEQANFTPSEINATLADEKVYLQPLTGAVNGKNTVYSIPDVPVDGSGQAVETDDVSLIQVYVGSDPLTAFLNGAVKVARLAGAAQTVTLFNPPAPSTSVSNQPLEPVGVWASYYRSRLSDHQYTVEVVQPGYAGNGTFIISDELQRVMPLVTFASATVAQNAAFQATGIVYPFNFPDIQAQAGAAVDETVTLTFNNDGTNVISPAVPASVAIVQGAGTLTFTATTPGANGNNVQIAIDASSLNAIPVSVVGDVVTIYANWNGNATANTLAVIQTWFPSAETISGGQIVCVASGTTSGQASTTAATPLASGHDAVTTPVTHSYTVTSTNSKGSGSQGTAIGYLDQTYEDEVTGFRITVVNPADHAAYGVPSIPASYNFQVGDVLNFIVKADATGANAAIRHCGNPGTAPAESNNRIAIPGIWTIVSSNYGSTAGDTVIVSTFVKSGNDPNVGEFYYVSYTRNKTAADYAIQMYTNPADAYAVYGQPNTVNRVSLGIQFMSQNGVQLFGVIQVPVVPGTNQASDQDYINAIASLATALPGSSSKANVIVPLSTSPTVQQYLSRFLTSQATIRNKGEAIGFIGYDQFATPASMRQSARSIANKRIIAIGTPLSGVNITNPSTGVTVEYPVSGEFIAAAMAGLNCNPANDVATTLTFQNLVGFTRLFIKYDDPTMDLMAADGLTCILDNNGSLKIRHYKSTDPSNPLTSEPTSTTISDYVAQVFRSDLNQFIGRKMLDSLTTDIQVVCNARLKSLVDQQIIAGYKSLSVVQDPVDPTQADVTVTYQPLFSLLYVSVVFTVNTNLNNA